MNSIKEQAVKRVKEDGLLIQQAAEEFGISSRKLYSWIKMTSPLKKKRSHHQVIRQKINKLNNELERLNDEVELWNHQQMTSH